MLLYCCAYLPTLWFCARMFDKSNFNPCSQLHGLLRMFDKSNFNPCSKLHGLARMFGKSNFNPCSQLYGSVFDPRRCLFYLPCAAIAFSQPLPGCGDASITHSLCTTWNTSSPEAMAISLSDVAVPKAYAPGTPPSTHAHTHCPAHLLPALPTCPLSHSCYTPGPDALLEPAAPMRNLTSYYLVLSSTSPLLLRLTCSLHSLALLASCSAVRLLYFTQSLSPHNGFSIHLSPWTAKIALAVVAGGTRHRRLNKISACDHAQTTHRLFLIFGVYHAKSIATEQHLIWLAFCQKKRSMGQLDEVIKKNGVGKNDGSSLPVNSIELVWMLTIFLHAGSMFDEQVGKWMQISSNIYHVHPARPQAVWYCSFWLLYHPKNYPMNHWLFRLPWQPISPSYCRSRELCPGIPAGALKLPWWQDDGSLGASNIQCRLQNQEVLCFFCLSVLLIQCWEKIQFLSLWLHLQDEQLVMLTNY